ncbi:MAG: ABC transporter ATP-binding protein/permease [Alphaproteobacteria bacterium]|nr:ABC transporter ATP-binding protein/permease [Alphaproteobacteria bacterium]
MDNTAIINRLPPEGLKTLPDKVWPFIWFFLRQIKGRFAVLAILGVFGAIAHTSASYFFGLIVDVFVNTTKGGDIWAAMTTPLALYIGLVLVASPVLYNTQGWLKAVTLPYFTMLVRRQLALYLHNHSYRYFQDDFAGRLAGKVTEMPHAIYMIISDIIGAFIYAGITSVTTLAIFVWVGPYFAIATAAYITLYFINLNYFMAKVTGLSELAARKRSVMRGRFVDILSNILLVKIFARRDHEDRYFTESLHDFGAAASAEEVKVTRMFRVQHVMNSSFMIVLCLMAIHGWQTGAMDTAKIAMLLPLASNMLSATFWLSEVYTAFFERLGEIQEGMDTIVHAHDVTDKPSAPALTVRNAAIKFDNVTFNYPSRPMFEGFNLHIPAHQRVGLVGPSGAGKSTLMQLLLRLHDVQAGRVEIDGQDIASVTQDSLRGQIAFIPQMADMLHRTVRENIAYGMLDASEAQIIEAAKAAQAHDFILGLRDSKGGQGYDAMVGERGVKLSGGQRQRIAIARAILKNAPIVVLDEATSSLDSESEKLIQESLKTLMQGRTVVAIAHRLSTIAHLDRLIVMDQGRIEEDGTHEGLLAKGGLYARLWNLQSGGFLGETPRHEFGD